MHRGSRPTVPEAAAAAAAETIQKPKLCQRETEKEREGELVGKQADRGKQERLADT